MRSKQSVYAKPREKQILNIRGIVAKGRKATTEEGERYYKLMAAMGTAMNLMNDLEGSPYYRQNLKNKLRTAFKAMEQNEALICDSEGIKRNGLEEEPVWDQLQDSYTYFESWLDLLFRVPQERHKTFDNYIQTGIAMYVDAEEEKVTQKSR